MPNITQQMSHIYLNSTASKNNFLATKILFYEEQKRKICETLVCASNIYLCIIFYVVNDVVDDLK